VEIIYIPCICTIKVSILLQYVRIFAPTRSSNPVMWWSAHLMIWWNVIFYIIEMFFDIFTCQPRALVWNELLNGWCWDINKILLSVAVFNLVSDVIILLLHQYSIWRLHMATRRKLGVSTIFGLGFLYVTYLYRERN
jgi:large subunit ribosomal protein L36e